jgi:hypothetical protein
MNKQVELHIETRINDIRSIYLKAVERLEMLKPGERIPSTTLAKDIAKEMGQKDTQIYPILLPMLVGYPRFVRRVGAKGGMERLPDSATQVSETNDNDNG